MDKKLNNSGFLWEIGTCIRTEYICWFNEILPCETMPDLSIFRSKLKHTLLPGERVVTDDRHRVDPKVLDPNEYRRDKTKHVVKATVRLHVSH